AAVTTAPQLEPYAPSLRRSFAALAELDDVITAQRIHGDLHLGQTLRTVKGWKIIDFEGEPAKSLADRVTPASPLRDVAGMLRSFDYAAGATLHQFGYGDQLRYRGDEWTQRNRAAFLAGYRDVAGDDPEHHRVLLRAYETDKAVYEVVYEARHRPAWLTIPLHAVERLARED
ncbi:MAG TPA: aminoglycoside phosphotransferase, partial [Pseudonocardiaceae bacterium]|nr:aminoglycoside phosphotransferase [Pseudonocardiaceae bacterium]